MRWRRKMALAVALALLLTGTACGQGTALGVWECFRQTAMTGEVSGSCGEVLFTAELSALPGRSVTLIYSEPTALTGVKVTADCETGQLSLSGTDYIMPLGTLDALPDWLAVISLWQEAEVLSVSKDANATVAVTLVNGATVILDTQTARPVRATFPTEDGANEVRFRFPAQTPGESY